MDICIDIYIKHCYISKDHNIASPTGWIFEFSKLYLEEYDIDNILTQYRAQTKIIECAINEFRLKNTK